MKARAKKSSSSKSARAKAPASAPKKVTRPTPGSAAKTERLARRWFEELWIKRNGDALAELMHPDAVGDTEAGEVRGHQQFRDLLHRPLLAAFPELDFTIEDIVADDHNAAVRWRFKARHGGELMGIPKSERRLSVSGMTWLRYNDAGQVIQGWDRWNATGMIAHLRDGSCCATVKAI